MKIYTFKNNILAAEWIIDYKRGRIDGWLEGYCNNPDEKKM